MENLLTVQLQADAEARVGLLKVHIGDGEESMTLEQRGPLRLLIATIEKMSREVGEEYDAKEKQS